MARQLTPQQEDVVERIIEIGHYDNPDQVIDKALRQMEEREQRLIELRAAIAAGDEAIARGDVVDWPPDFFEQLDREATGEDHEDLPLQSDVGT